MTPASPGSPQGILKPLPGDPPVSRITGKAPIHGVIHPSTGPVRERARKKLRDTVGAMDTVLTSPRLEAREVT